MQYKQKLIERGIIKHKGNVYVNKYGNLVGVYRTKGCAKKIYIEDKYATINV